MKIYDNGGLTIDRYTIITEEGGGMAFAMNSTPNSPQGFNQYLGDARDFGDRMHLGERVRAKDLPHDVLIAIIDRIDDID